MKPKLKLYRVTTWSWEQGEDGWGALTDVKAYRDKFVPGNSAKQLKEWFRELGYNVVKVKLIGEYKL